MTTNKVITGVIEHNLSYLESGALFDIIECVQKVEQAVSYGDFIETGCALGGSAIVIASAKDKSRPLKVYDVFGMIPEPGHRDGDDCHSRYEEIKSGRSAGLGVNEYYGYKENLLDCVKQSFCDFGLAPEENNVSFHKGLYEKVLNINGPVAFAHIDCDWHDSVKLCLERIVPNLLLGGRIIIDDYYYYSGCKKAVDDFFSEKPGFFFCRKSRLHIIKM